MHGRRSRGNVSVTVSVRVVNRMSNDRCNFCGRLLTTVDIDGFCFQCRNKNTELDTLRKENERLTETNKNYAEQLVYQNGIAMEEYNNHMTALKDIAEIKEQLKQAVEIIKNNHKCYEKGNGKYECDCGTDDFLKSLKGDK